MEHTVLRYEKEVKYMNNENKTSINWYPGHMAKTKKQIQEDLKLVDVVVEILDSRIPKSSQNPDISKMMEGKKRIIVLNKSDLADENENKKWQSFFNNKGIPTIIANSNSGIGSKETIKKVREIMTEDMLKQEQKGRIQKNIRLMIVGIPNVGKSSFINRIAKKNSTIVGNKPGVTKQKQWIRIENNIELLDTPGVLWPKFENQEVALNLAFTGTIKDEIMDEYEIAFYLISFLYENYKINLQERYSITDNELVNVFCEDIDTSEKIVNLIELIGKKRGAIISGGKLDGTKTARLILEDFRSGKFGRISLEKVK